MIAQRLTYGTRITGDHRRWCAICGTQRPTERGKFVPHQKPGARPGDPNCPNSGQKVNQQEQAG